MTERPILFSGSMVRAILNGRKTQTRRLYKSRCCDAETAAGPLGALPSPYGSPGDRLWVRETWGRSAHDRMLYRASDDLVQAVASDEGGWVSNPTWRPSIHMPRWASRITLEIISVRVQRLQDISEHDAREEGVEELDSGDVRAADIWRMAKSMGDTTEGSRTWFACLWDSINGKRAPWASNPWVWAIEFTMVEG